MLICIVTVMSLQTPAVPNADGSGVDSAAATPMTSLRDANSPAG